MVLNDKRQLILIILAGLFGLGYWVTHHLLFIFCFLVCQLLLLTSAAKKQLIAKLETQLKSPVAEMSLTLLEPEVEGKPELKGEPKKKFKPKPIEGIEHKNQFDPGVSGEFAPTSLAATTEIDTLEGERILYSRDSLIVKDLKHILENISLRIAENRVEGQNISLEMSDDLLGLFEEVEVAFTAETNGSIETISVEDYVSQVDDIIQAYIALVIHLSQQSSGAAERIQKMTRQIDTIFTVVEDVRSIADKTSLVALNAAIEAARSGQVGRSYAFVAKEVQKLSAHSDRFSLEIKKEMNRAKQSVAATKEVVATIAISDVEVAIATKSFIDQSLGRLKELLDCSTEVNIIEAPRVKAMQNDRLKATIGDIQRLLAVVHVKINLLRKVDILSENGKVNLKKLGEKVDSLLRNQVSDKKKYR